MTEVKVNQYGTNEKIKGHILSDEKMREFGFQKNYYEGTDHEQYSEYWWWTRGIQLPKKYKGMYIDFIAAIYKETEEVRIDVLDEDFCQPYDYQMILEKHPNSELSLIIKEEVEKYMSMLQDAGILSGHEYGEYI